MMRVPGMLLIGAFHRNAGKTSLSTDIIGCWRRRVPIVALKVTVIRNSDTALEPDGYVLTEEKKWISGKDTARMLRAGASHVYWLRCREDTVQAGISALLRDLPSGRPLVCEGNSVRRFVRPDVFIMVRNSAIDTDKSSARAVCGWADLVLTSHNGKPELPPEAVQYRNGLWRLSGNALRQAGIHLAAMEMLPCRSGAQISG